MAKKQSFGDKVLRQKAEAKKMAKIVVARRNPNGHFSFRSKMVDANDVKAELKAAQA
ncbi:hypothetical protein JYT20_00620 [Rhodothermus sp. AH-315-K08]|nr:hypothetical protein [Rhodothermus sp. AH-315-K08]